ncbi:NAD+ synthase [Desulfoluna limicola]|uniref:Glutamine-dependent NAD(+) synthetase n=2 Tax=Desulfoluna limicola TaxID=2810562 RepID=A0ABM7PLJ6_9BACT|nr:NAD+ synthase [Desulfoluna limicola]
MDMVRIAAGQINPIIGDFEGNCRKMEEAAKKAREAGCRLVVFPELSVSGYPPRDLLERRSFIKDNLNAVERLMENIQGIAVLLGYVERNGEPGENNLYNAALLFEDGRVLHKVRKRLLPTYDVFDERRYFEPGSESKPVMWNGVRLGITICEDMWNDKEVFESRKYRVDPVADLCDQGVELLINISASPFNTGKPAFRESLIASVARRHKVPVFYVNQVGGNDSLLFDGASLGFYSDGTLAVRAESFVEDLLVFEPKETSPQRIADVPACVEEEVYRALVMGTRDYVTKCGFKKVVIGLSGGIDSALTAAVAADALGAENVSTVFMPSEYTSSDNDEDTKGLAENLGCHFDVVPIAPMFDAFLGASDIFCREEHGITEQNIQARVRGTLLMALSNKTGALVLTTGNKSELAVGYCTLYGDMNGGLAVISDVPKTLVWDISRFINRNGEVIPQRIIDKVPSAELRPDQSDQDELPAYEVLDAILHAYVEQVKAPAEIVAMGYDAEVVADVVRRVEINEYKRQQAAPGLRVTAKAFGYGRRYPIAKRIA